MRPNEKRGPNRKNQKLPNKWIIMYKGVQTAKIKNLSICRFGRFECKNGSKPLKLKM